MRRSSLTSSSLPLQILVYFDVYFSWLWFVLTLVLFIYKGDQFPYPSDILAAEVVSGVALCNPARRLQSRLHRLLQQRSRPKMKKNCRAA